MSAPPGIYTNPPKQSSLPARPSPSTTTQAALNSHHTFTLNRPTTAFSFQPRSVASASLSYRTANPSVAAPSTTTPTSYQPQGSFPSQPSRPNFFASSENYVQATPQIRNPFPHPSQARSADFLPPPDPELEAQIAQWQTAYASRDERVFSVARSNTGVGVHSATGANHAPLGSKADATVTAEMATAAAHAAANSGIAAVVTDANGRQKTVVRSGGGQTWQDPTLLEWDPSHFRIFVGNIAGEVTDESLLKAFSAYSSVHKARVIRDKRTTKSKGFGFVSFRDGDDYFRAAREMQGKYIGSHPVIIRKSTTEIKATVPKERGKKGKGHGRKEDRTGAGVGKKGDKMKGGLKVLG